MVCAAADLAVIANNAGLRAKAAWPRTLAELTDVLEAHFRRVQRSSSGTRADAEAVIAVIAEHLGGSTIYLPRGDSLRRALRDLRIYHEFDGRNVKDLARRHHLSTVQIRSIIAKHRRGPAR
jgi:Mor family transcriptional regulator